MIPNSFRDELEKNAALPGLMVSLGKFFQHNVPAMLGSVRGGIASAGLTGAVSSRVIGGVAGGATGAYGGSKVGDPENKGRNTLIGGAVGAAAGAIGMGKLAPKLQNFGAKAETNISNLGRLMQRKNTTGGMVGEHIIRNAAEKTKAVGADAPIVKNLFGMGSKTQATREVTSKPGLVSGAVGQAMKSFQTIAAGGTSAIGGVVGGVGGAVAGSQTGDGEHKFRNALAGGVLGAAGGTYAKGIGNVLKDNWKSLETFNKTVGGKTYQFQRSGLGKVVNPLMASGAGFGAMEAMSSTNADGSKRSIGGRLAHGAGTAVGWAAAPKLMTGKLLGYDMPKMFTGMKKPKQLGQENIQM